MSNSNRNNSYLRSQERCAAAGTRRSSKRAILVGVWLALAGGLLLAITHDHSGAGDPGGRETAHRSYVPTALVLADRWPEIVAHAAAAPRGHAGARYTLAEFGDFQCPQCARVAPLLAGMLAEYPSDVNLIFIQRPLPRVHRWALPAAQAAQIAAARGGFWPMYDALYSHQDDLNPDTYPSDAAHAGLRSEDFLAASARGEGRPAVVAAARFSDGLGVRETPLLALRDNATGAVTEYVGTDGGEAAGDAGIPGVRALLAAPPWAAKGAAR